MIWARAMLALVMTLLSAASEPAAAASSLLLVANKGSHTLSIVDTVQGFTAASSS